MAMYTNFCDTNMHIQWNLWNKDTAGPCKSVLISEVSLIRRFPYVRIGNNSGPRTLVRIVEASIIGGVHFRRFHCLSLPPSHTHTSYMYVNITVIVILQWNIKSLEPTPQESNWCYNPYMDIPTHPHTIHTYTAYSKQHHNSLMYMYMCI